MQNDPSHAPDLSNIRTAAPGPHPGAVALVSAALFAVSLVALESSPSGAHFPMRADASSGMLAYFSTSAIQVQICAFFQFGAALTLGIFTAAATYRMQSLGIRATGLRIALFGGWLAAFNSLVVACALWVLAQSGVVPSGVLQSGVVQDAALVRALYLFSFAFDGPGYAAALGLLLAGLSVTGLFSRLLPRWLAICGLVLAVAGEFSAVTLLNPRFGLLIPITRFPGYLWMIVAGFVLPRTTSLRQEKAA